MTPQVYSGANTPHIDSYGYYLDHEYTHKKVAHHLLAGQSVFLSWSDQRGGVYEFVFSTFAVDMKANGNFKYSPKDLFVTIIDKGSFSVKFVEGEKEFQPVWAKEIVEKCGGSLPLVTCKDIESLVDGITYQMDRILSPNEENN